jgi:hypothetical protein
MNDTKQIPQDDACPVCGVTTYWVSNRIQILEGRVDSTAQPRLVSFKICGGCGVARVAPCAIGF